MLLSILLVILNSLTVVFTARLFTIMIYILLKLIFRKSHTVIIVHHVNFINIMLLLISLMVLDSQAVLRFNRN